ncbi:MAG: sulfite exporter TauE/SafE family protein, partial [Pseudohongiella sp.]|nr:sulfite exporter TauE/SafE family protein [Pseudohongiella sp.]
AALLIIVGSIVFWGRSQMPGVMQQLNAQMSYGLLFVIGVLTGFHCIGMCGSFVVNYARSAETRAQAIRSHVAYGSGKTLSYVMIGAGFGLLGALITITPQMRGIAALLAGVFLLLFGLKMLNVWPALRRLNIRLPAAFTREVASEIHQRKHPFVIGLLNGLLLGCGPLQAMYIMAAGTGDPVQGGILLFFFGLGTLPPLLGYGFFANVLSAKAVSEMVRVSGILVIAMGIMMAQRGIGFLSM